MISTTAYAAFLLASKFLLPSAHERSETILHLLAETVFQTILFAAFFTFLRFILPRSKRNLRPVVALNSSPQLPEAPTVEHESASQELTGVSAHSDR
jgi:hypothetical protein